jgi:hypothetical protein
MNSKAKDWTNKAKPMILFRQSLQLQAKSRCVPGWPLLAPLYRWPGLEVLVGFDTDSSPYGDFTYKLPYSNTEYIGSYLGP